MANTSWTCPRCHYNTEYKHRLLSHLTRRYECKPEYDDIERNEILNNMFCQTEKPYTCHDCKHGFTTKAALSKHKHICKQKLDNIVGRVAKEILKNGATTVINNITNITNNNVHNGNNIQINALGNEDVTHISKSFLDQAVKRRDKGLLELLRNIHFHENAPNNRNLRIRNKKSNMIEYHNGIKWIYEDKTKLLTDVMDKGHSIMQDHFDENKDKIKTDLPRYWYDAICDWFVKTRDGKTEEANKVLRGLYIMILNESSFS